MDIRSDQEFLAWLAEAGIGVDPRFPHSDRLVFTASPDLSRFLASQPGAQRASGVLAHGRARCDGRRRLLDSSPGWRALVCG
jgi:hypothetical protein